MVWNVSGGYKKLFASLSQVGRIPMKSVVYSAFADKISALQEELDATGKLLSLLTILPTVLMTLQKVLLRSKTQN